MCRGSAAPLATAVCRKVYYECSHKSQLKNWLRHPCGKKGADVREVVGAGSAGGGGCGTWRKNWNLDLMASRIVNLYSESSF